MGVIALLAAAVSLRLVARRAQHELGALRWLLTGSLLALPAAAGTGPSARLLIAPAIGVCALLGALLVRAWQSLAVRWRWTALWLCAAIVLVHGLLAARNAYTDAAELRAHAQSVQRWARRAEIPRAAGDFDVVLVSASDFVTAANLPWLRLYEGLPLPHSYRRLSGAMQAHDVRRVDAHTIDLDVLSSDVSDAFAGSIYRGRQQPLLLGERVRLPGMDVQVLAVLDGNPWRLRFRFDRALDDPHLIWLHARPGGLRRFVLPREGETLRLPRAALPWDRP
jgi:hypothetical protein